MPSFQLRLPDVVVCVNETWTDELALTIYDLGVRRWSVNLWSNLGDLVIDYQERMLLERNYVVFVGLRRDMCQDGPIL